MRRLRTISSRRLATIAAAVAAVAVTAGIAQAVVGSAPTPAPKPLDRAVYDALRAPKVAGITARIHFTNNLLPSGSLPNGTASPIATGADGRLWLTGDGRFRLELQSDNGDAQIVADGRRFSVYDAASNTAYTGPLPEERGEPRAEPTLAGVRRALDKLGAVWTLSGARPTSTAGRPSYTVRIAPKDDGGLLGAAELAWDAEKGVPLRAAVYAQGQQDPVLELAATDISYGAIPAGRVTATPPPGAKVVEVDPAIPDAQGRPTHVHGVEAVQKRLGFKLAAPATLAGLPRRDVRLVRYGDEAGALGVYGRGFGTILVFQHRAEPSTGRDALRLPEINIDGATGAELATALGTIVSFERDGIAYTVAGSVPPVAAENAARGLR